MINKQTIVHAEMPNKYYSLAFTGRVEDIKDSEVVLNPCIIGYKCSNLSDYIYHRIIDDKPIIESIKLDGLKPVDVDQYERYLDVLKTDPINLRSFTVRMLKYINIALQEQEPDISAID